MCRGCIDDEEKDYDLIRSTIDGHPDPNAEGVAELSGVDLKCVLRMLDTGKIATIWIGEKVECGRCGAPAIGVSQRLCQSCLDKLDREKIETKKRMKTAALNKEGRRDWWLYQRSLYGGKETSWLAIQGCFT